MKERCRCHSFARTTYIQGGDSDRERAFFVRKAKPQFAPDRLVDVEHIRLVLDIDLASKRLVGTCSTRFRVLAPEVRELRFHGVDLKVSKVAFASGASLPFQNTGKEIIVSCPQTLKRGEQGEIEFTYSVHEPQMGVYFIAADADQPHKFPQLWTQGQDEDNRYWFPCHDAPNEKASTEMIVTVDSDLYAVSNGSLVSQSEVVENGRKRRRFHYLQKQPHSSYLVTLCVGPFTPLAEVWSTPTGRKVPVEFYALPGQEEETRHSFRNTTRMLEFFSAAFSCEYPFEKYAQVVAQDFIYGGMENTSATTQTEYTLHPPALEQEASSDYLVAHELGHQWFGDLLTCKEWSHAWLNEGFATLCETLWSEHAYGPEEGAYEIYLNEKAYKDEDATYRRPIVTAQYIRPSDLFDRHLYEKGGRVLYMLRDLLTPDVWKEGVALYLRRHREGTVETVDLQRAFEEVSGRNLSWFFDQWVFRAGHPEVKVDVEVDSTERVVKVHVAQTQKNTAGMGVFRFPLSVVVVSESGKEKRLFEVAERQHHFVIPFSEKPTFVSVNPGNVLLADWVRKIPRAFLMRQIQEDSDVMGRIFAAKDLAKDFSREAFDALKTGFSKESFWGAQGEIALALAKQGHHDAAGFLREKVATVSHPKARRMVVEALSRLPRSQETFDVLVGLMDRDLSPVVVQAAARALGLWQTPEAMNALLERWQKRKLWHDLGDCGILAGLATFGHHPEVLSVLRTALHRKYSMFIRRTAAACLESVGRVQPKAVAGLALPLLRDENFFVRMAAIHACESLGLGEARPVLMLLAESCPDPRTARAAWLAGESLSASGGASAAPKEVKEELEQLRSMVSSLWSKVEALEKMQKEGSS